MINFVVISYFTGYRYKLVIRRTVLMSIITAIMAFIVWGIEAGLSLFLSTESRWQSIVILAVCAGIGGLFYAAASLKSKLLTVYLVVELRHYKEN